MFDVAALGEILIDFTPAGFSERGGMCFERNAGGAPANVAVCVARLGGRAAFIGKAGKDMFGRFLRDVLAENGVDAAGMRFDDGINTTLAFVQLDESGDRSFSFYRNPGADTALRSEEVDCGIIRNAKVFHFGSLSLTHEPARSATRYALECAREAGCMISCDPNLRLPLWKSSEAAREQICSVMDFAHILKISEEEMEFITGETDLDRGTQKIRDSFGTGAILVTRGSEGSYFRHGDETGRAGTFNELKAVDTTGAGDAFLGGFLYRILRDGVSRPEDIDAGIMRRAVRFASATASLCVTGKGAIPSMPGLDRVLDLTGEKL